jgi:DNA-binding transcriptional ArsR family regulator
MSTSHLEAPVLLPEPAPENIALESVFQALGDPVRLEIVRKLNTAPEAKACGTFDLPVGKSTASHHFKVLREAGLIRQRLDGRERLTELRLADLEKRFPGLLNSVLAADR